MNRLACDEGEVAVARAAAGRNTAYCVSTVATRSMEEIADAGGSDALRWFQLYVYQDRAFAETLIRRAEKAGYKALVVTVDLANIGKRESDLRGNFKLPDHIKLAHFVKHATPMDSRRSDTSPSADDRESDIPGNQTKAVIDATLSWSDLQWIRSITDLPIILKGILTAEDAKLAVHYGCAGVIVSNHGGRQLDTAPASIEALPEVVDAIDGRIDVYIDGGIRRGSDVLMALALGAKAVFIGRAYLWGLGWNGQKGVERVLDILNTELRLAMTLSGVRSMKDITSSLVTRVESYFSKL